MQPLQEILSFAIGEKCSTWSLWLMLLVNYNIPPWLTTKRHFMMLSLIILGPTIFITSEQFDKFIEPLVEELKTLWDVGVNIRDTGQFNGMGQCNMKVILMWTMHDLPTYGIVVGLVTKGYRGCPCCGTNTVSRMSRALQ
jgi:hypothetical protein